MSHEITSIDRQQGLTQAWHKLTEILPSIDLLTSWLASWDIRKAAMREENGDVSEFYRLVCTDDPSIRIGNPVNESYGIVTNGDFLRTVSGAIREIPGAKVASTGSVCGRSRIFVSVQLDELAEFKAAGRVFNPYLNFLSSHDQSAPFVVNTSNICTVCNNTFGMNLGGMSEGKSASGKWGMNSASERSDKGAKAVRFGLKHTKNVQDRLQNVPAMVDSFLGAQARFQVTMDQLAKAPISVDSANALFAGFVSDGADLTVKPSARRVNQIGRLTELFSRGAGNRGENRADVFSAGTDYYSHESSGGANGHIMRQVESSEYGTGAQTKRDLFNLLQDDDKVAKVIDTGRKVLALV